MQQGLSVNEESLVIKGLQALLPVILQHWGKPEAFREAAVPVLSEAMGLDAEQASKANALAEQTLRQVTRIRAAQFRPYQSDEALDQAYTRLVPTATEAPVRQGFLWLAFQVQRSANEFLAGDRAKEALAKLKMAVDEQKALFGNLPLDSPRLSLESVERILTVLAQKKVADVGGEFQYAVICGHLMEWARAEAREGEDRDLLAGGGATVTDDARLLTPLVPPVRHAALNEAHQRFLKLNDQAKSRRFDGLRKLLSGHVVNLAVAAPHGFEAFCLAVEALLCPYPAQLEWVRSYLKPLYTNAQQSTVFDNCLNEATISQRYQKLLEEKSANVTMLELSRAFALAKVSRLAGPEETEFLNQLNLRSEFNWPTSVEEIKAKAST